MPTSSPRDTLPPAEPRGATAPGHCAHCGLPVEHDGEGPAFCCAGCEAAWSIVHEAGLEAYYQRRTALPDRPAPRRADAASIPVVELPDGLLEARLVVTGIRCAACVWLCERVLQEAEGVAEAHVSHGSGRAILRWDPRKTDLAGLVGRLAALGYPPRVDARPDRPDRDLLIRLGVAAFAAMNVMMLVAPLYIGGVGPAYAALFRWAALVLATPVATWCAVPFHRGALAGLRRGILHVDLPISLAVLVTWLHGVHATLAGGEAWLDSLTMLVALLLGGRLLEQRGRARATAAVRALAAATPELARRVTGGTLDEVPTSSLVPGDLVEVGLGGVVPADGEVVEGRARLRMDLLTGESEPVERTAGDEVVGGAEVVEGRVRVRVLRPADDGLLARMGRIVLDAIEQRVDRSAADRVAPWFTAATLATAGLTWWGHAGGLPGLEAAVAVLVVACPCALALAEPLSGTAALQALASRGVLLKSLDVLRRLARVDRVVLDKTGTLTSGRLEVVEADDETLRLAAGVERASHHPIARAILDEAARRGLPIPLGRDIREVPGVGVEGLVDGRRVRVRGDGPGAVVVEGAGRIVLADRPREDAAEAVAALRRRARVALVTGDRPEVAERIARAAGIEEVHAEVRPEEKVAYVAGGRTLMVGDGLNDGPALAAAAVGLAMSEGVPASLLAADGVIVRPGLLPAVAALDAGRVFRRTVRVNIARSLGYNVLAVAAAAAGLVGPLAGAVLMALSSALVVAGAASVPGRLDRVSPRRQGREVVP